MPKGAVAKRDDWVKAFGSDDMNKVIEEVCMVWWSVVAEVIALPHSGPAPQRKSR